MSAVQRDYFERMIEQAAQALGVIAQLIRAGEFESGPADGPENV